MGRIVRMRRIAGLLTACTVALAGCGQTGESVTPETQSRQEETQTEASRQQETQTGIVRQEGIVNFYQTQQIENPIRAQGFGGWILGSRLTEKGLYYLVQPSSGPNVELKLYRVPLEELYQEDVLSGCFPAVKPLTLTEEVMLPETLTEVPDPMRASETVWRFFAGETEDLYALARNYQQDALYLYHVDAQGQETSRIEVTEALQDMEPLKITEVGCLEDNSCAVDGQGRIYLTDLEEGKLWILDAQGELLHQLELPPQTQQLAVLQEGQIYLVAGEGAESRILRLDGETGSMEPVLEMPQTAGSGALVPGQQDRLLYRDSNGLYACDLEQGTAECVVLWKEVEISGQHILQARETSPGKIYVLEDDYSLTQVSQISAQDIPSEKQVVTLAVVEAFRDTLNPIVVEFNKHNAYYEVEIISYDYFDGPQKLEAELATGNAPDLLDTTLIYADKLVEKGLLADLSPYLEDGKGIEREDLVEAVLRCNTIDGVLTCIPWEFGLEVLVGKPQVVGTEPGWTLEEYMACIREHMGLEVMGSNSFSGGNQSGHAIVNLPMYGDMAHWADYEQGKALFDSADFRELLELAGSYQVTEPAVDLMSAMELEDGRVLTYISAIYTMEQYLLLNASLQQEVTYKGYPTADGSPAYSLRGCDAYAVNAQSQVKDGAWALIEFMITYYQPESQQEGDIIMVERFSALESWLDYQLQQSMVKSYQHNSNYELIYDQDGQLVEAAKYVQTDRNGNIIAESPAATQEDVDNLRRLIDAAENISNANSNTLFQIVYSEVDAFLNGQRTAQETVDVIQNRIQLFMDENK